MNEDEVNEINARYNETTEHFFLIDYLKKGIVVWPIV